MLIQLNLSTTVIHGELQKWPLLTGGLCSERQKLPIRFSRDKLRLAFVNRKSLFAGVVMHRFDSTCLQDLSFFPGLEKGMRLTCPRSLQLLVCSYQPQTGPRSSVC